MKQQIISALAAVLVCATTALATTMNSPNLTSNAGRFVSGGNSSTGYVAKPATTATIAGGGACGIRRGDIN
ncbi:MAG TPA: hypothetical protein HPP97_07865 [Desulfuromonadales bacterium]|nr:hypothetical protein [Desulfuromonadales bacterium]